MLSTILKDGSHLFTFQKMPDAEMLSTLIYRKALKVVTIIFNLFHKLSHEVVGLYQGKVELV